MGPVLTHVVDPARNDHIGILFRLQHKWGTVRICAPSHPKEMSSCSGLTQCGGQGASPGSLDTCVTGRRGQGLGCEGGHPRSEAGRWPQGPLSVSTVWFTGPREAQPPPHVQQASSAVRDLLQGEPRGASRTTQACCPQDSHAAAHALSSACCPSLCGGGWGCGEGPGQHPRGTYLSQAKERGREETVWPMGQT